MWRWEWLIDWTPLRPVTCPGDTPTSRSVTAGLGSSLTWAIKWMVFIAYRVPFYPFIWPLSYKRRSFSPACLHSNCVTIKSSAWKVGRVGPAQEPCCFVVLIRWVSSNALEKDPEPQCSERKVKSLLLLLIFSLPRPFFLTSVFGDFHPQFSRTLITGCWILLQPE